MKKNLFAILALLVPVACTQLELTEQQSKNGEDKIHVSIEDDQSRVQLNSDLKTVWTKGDQIRVCGASDLAIWQFNGNTGARSGELTRIWRAGYGSNPGLDKYYALYPEQKFLGWSRIGQDPILFFAVSDTQEYMEGSYGLHSNLMIASSTSGNEFTFKNMSSYLRVSLTGTKKVSSVTLKSNAGEPLSGEIYFKAKDPFNFVWNGPTGSQITLTSSAPVQLGNTPVDFYFSVLPVTMTGGLSITVSFADGSEMVKSTSRTVTLERNAILPMAVIDTDNAFKQSVEISHTSNSFEYPLLYSSGTSLSGVISWGDGEQTLIGSDSGTYLYWDNKPAHTVLVRCDGAAEIAIPSLKGVTSIDFSNF